MSLTRYVEGKFGVKTRTKTNPLATSVLTTVTKVLQNNPDRLSYTVVNLGGTALYLAFDNEVSSTRGILLVASGGSLTLNAEDDGELVGYELYGISATSSNNIFVVITEGE